MEFNLTTNGSTTPFNYNAIDSERGENSTIAIYGTFNGGSVLTQVSFDDGTTWINLKKSDGTNLAVTSNEVNNIYMAPCLMRFTLSGATTSPTSPDVKISFRY
jgi:hypothetical protein